MGTPAPMTAANTARDPAGKPQEEPALEPVADGGAHAEVAPATGVEEDVTTGAAEPHEHVVPGAEGTASGGLDAPLGENDKGG